MFRLWGHLCDLHQFDDVCDLCEYWDDLGGKWLHMHQHCKFLQYYEQDLPGLWDWLCCLYILDVLYDLREYNGYDHFRRHMFLQSDILLLQ